MNNKVNNWFPEILQATKNNTIPETIDRINSISTIQFQRYASTSTPFVIKCQSKIYHQSEAKMILKTEFPNYPIKVRSTVFDEESGINNRMIPLHEYIKLLEDKDSQDLYASNNNIWPGFMEALNIVFPSFYLPSSYNTPRFWLGPSGSQTPLHKDSPDNFSYNYFGKKHWKIYPPSEYIHLYMFNPLPNAPDHAISRVDAFKPDPYLFPKFALAKGIDVIVNDNELLYIPAGWSHFVENLNENLTVNFWLSSNHPPAVLTLSK